VDVFYCDSPNMASHIWHKAFVERVAGKLNNLEFVRAFSSCKEHIIIIDFWIFLPLDRVHPEARHTSAQCDRSPRRPFFCFLSVKKGRETKSRILWF
jgi:hypothetical protein